MRANELFLVMAIAAPIAAIAQTANVDAVKRGQQLYEMNMCNACHGTVGNGGERTSGPQIAPDVWPLEAMKIQLRNPRALMPRYDAKFVSDAEVADIHAFLSSIKPGRKAKDIPLLSNL